MSCEIISMTEGGFTQRGIRSKGAKNDAKRRKEGKEERRISNKEQGRKNDE